MRERCKGRDDDGDQGEEDEGKAEGKDTTQAEDEGKTESQVKEQGAGFKPTDLSPAEQHAADPA